MDYTDPAGMTEDERMSDAELRTVREFLGLDQLHLATYLGVQDRTVRRWEAGTTPIPDGVRIEVERLEAHTAEQVTSAIEELMDIPDPVVAVYRDDNTFWTAHPEAKPLGAAWHRAVIARTAQEVPALEIAYRE